MAINEGKRIRAARDGVSVMKLYAIDDAVKLVKDRATAKFDETIEVAMNLGVDPRHADQMVRGVCNLPNGSGRTVRVAVGSGQVLVRMAQRADELIMPTAPSSAGVASQGDARPVKETSA